MENDEGRSMVPAPRGGKGNAPRLRFGVPETSPSPYAAVRLPNFRRFIIGLFAFTMAIQIQGTVVGWQIYELTHDKLALGLIGLAEALPFIGAALYAGHVADRHDRRRTVLAALTAAAGRLACSCWCCPLLLPSAPRLVVRAIYGVIVMSGFARSFLQPARQALAAELVPRPLYGNAITWRSGTWQLASVLGPAVGGLLYALGGTTLAYAAVAALMLVGLASIMIIRHRSEIKREHTEAVARSLATGHSIHAERAAHPRRPDARPLLRALWRRHRAAAGVRGRDPARRAVGTWPAARRTGDRRGGDERRARVDAPVPQGGARAVHRGRDFRRLHHRVRSSRRACCSPCPCWW